MVGALADWFAVTALFRHPLGLPIPHTAIIPRKKDQIGASLGTFVQENFLTRSVVEEQADHDRRARPARRLPGRARAAPSGSPATPAAVVTALSELLRDEDLEPAVADLVDRKLHATPAAPAVARVLELVVEGDRHQEVLSAALRGLSRFLQENRLVFRAQLGDASPVVGARLGRRPGVRPRLRRAAGLPRRGRQPTRGTSCAAPTTPGCAPTCTRCAPTRTPRRGSRT